MHAREARRTKIHSESFFLKMTTLVTLLTKVVTSPVVLYQNAHVYIKMNEMGAWEGKKCTQIFFFLKKGMTCHTSPRSV